MSRLSGFPSGLLDLLGSQNFGEAPNDLSQTIVPTVEIADLYLLSKQTIVIGDNVAGWNNGTNANKAVTVPTGERWRVHHAALLCTTAPAEAIELTLGVTQDGIYMPISPTQLWAASQTRALNMTAQPFWIPGGSRINALGVGSLGAPTGSIQLLVSKLRG